MIKWDSSLNLALRMLFGVTLFSLVLLMLFGATLQTQAHDTGHMAHGTPAASLMAHGDHDSADLSMGAAYFRVANSGDTDDRLVSAQTNMADAVEVHEVVMTDGVMEMSPLHDGLVIPAGETVALEPGGYHIMLIGLTESLIAGDTYELELTFEHAGKVTLEVPVLRSEPDDDEGKAEDVDVGDLTIEGAWSRQAPKIEAGHDMHDATPDPAHDHAGSVAATPSH